MKPVLVLLGLWLALTFGTVWAAIAAQQQEGQVGVGSIEGRVLDSEGGLVEGAKVFAEPTDCTYIGKLRFAYSDKNGRFLLTDVIAGTEMLAASKEQDGYPNALFAPFASDLNDQLILPRVFVRANETTHNVVVTLSPKGGRLLGFITDAVTTQPVDTARITLVREDDPKLLYSTNPGDHASFNFVLPAKAFKMEVSAPGYETWTSSEISGSGNHGIVILPGSKKEIVVRLKKLTKR